MNIVESIKTIARPVAYLVTGVYLALSLFIAIHSTMMVHDHMAFSECPFSFGGESLCTRNLLGYLDELDWVSLYTVISLSVVSIAIVYGVSVFVPVVLYYRAPQRLYVQLFSDGLLHPKAP